MRAVSTLGGQDQTVVFTREDIRHQIGIGRPKWKPSYSPTFQGMRSDQPGGALKVGEKYRNVFRKVARRKNTLTDYGRTLLKSA